MLGLGMMFGGVFGTITLGERSTRAGLGGRWVQASRAVIALAVVAYLAMALLGPLFP